MGMQTNRRINARRKSKQSDSGCAGAIGIDDWARVGAELRIWGTMVRLQASAADRRKTWDKVFELFNLDWCPEQIASVVSVCHETIYRRIYAEIKAGRLDRKHLHWEWKNGGGYGNVRLEILRKFR